MNEYLIKKETITATADAIRANLPMEQLVIREDLIADGNMFVDNAVTIAYYEYVDYNISYDEQGAHSTDGFIAFGYLPNNEGSIVPVIFKTDLDAAEYDQEFIDPDYEDKFYYVGNVAVDGKIYNKWRKIEVLLDGGFTWTSEFQQYVYTNEIVGTATKPSTEEIDPVDFPEKIQEVYEAGKAAGGGDLLNQIIDRSITTIDLTKFGDITTIGAYAFCQCVNLTEVILPEVQEFSIGEYAFYNCPNIETVFYSGTKSDWDTYVTIGVGNEPLLNSISYYSDVDMSKDGGSYWHYVNGVPTLWSQVSRGLEYTLLDDGTYSVTGIGTCNDTYIILPESYNGVSVTNVGDNAFNNCRNITGCTVANSVTSIGNYAFSTCISLTSITIPDGVTSIGESAFSTCIGLTSITIPDSVTSIGGYAFSNCSNLANIALSSSLEAIAMAMFKTCKSLASITIPSSVTSIDASAFASCERLTSVVIPDSVTSIGAGAFYKCTNLENIELGRNSQCTSIGDHAFADCASLEKMLLPARISTIGDSTFKNCTHLIHVDLASHVSTINYHMFYGCESLVSIAINRDIKTVAPEAFANCTSFSKIYCDYQSIDIWSKISDISEINNEAFTNATVYYYSQTVPTIEQDTFLKANGNWWYYNDLDEIVIWEFSVNITIENFNKFGAATIPVADQSFILKPFQTSTISSIRAANSNNTPLTLSANAKYVNSTDAVNYTFKRRSALSDSTHYYELTLSNLVDDVRVTISGSDIGTI